MDLIELNTSITQRHPWELARFEILLDFINNALPASEDMKTIGDIGCGDCYFARELIHQRNDLVVIAVDTAYDAVTIKEKMQEINHPRFHLFQNISDAEKYLRGQRIEMILLLDVIEHIKNEKPFLQEILSGSLIDKETQVLITVPAYQTLFTRHDLFLKHFRRYSKNSLEKLLRDAGLLPLRSGYFFMTLLPVRLLRKLGEKLGFHSKPKGIGQWSNSERLTKFFKNFLLLDYKFSKILGKSGIQLPGLSVYCLCKKPAS